MESGDEAHHLTAEEKRRNEVLLYLGGLASLGSSVLVGQATPLIVTQCCGGDTPKAVVMLGRMASAAAALEFLLSPYLGRLADTHGRKAVLYLGPLATLVLRGATAANTTSLATVVVGRVTTGALVPAYFTALRAAMADMYLDDGDELLKVTGRVQAIMGVSMVLANVVGGKLAKRSLALPYAVAAVLGAVGIALVRGVKETLHHKGTARGRPSIVGFIELCCKRRGGSTLFPRLHVIHVLSLLPGTMGDVPTMFSREVRGWGPEAIGWYNAANGAAMAGLGVVTGKVSAAISNKNLCLIGLASLVAGNLLHAASERSGIQAVLALLVLTVAQVRTGPVDVLTAQLSQEYGMGKGEYAAHKANLNAVVKILAPLLFAHLYSKISRRIPFIASACFGTVALNLALSIRNEEWTKFERKNRG
eukprot:Sspe_Gene.25491::Locus_10259_Transcript_1_1_Confidence_1.000_Length_1629::g.25491::m.25491/K08151/tetA; MFS transporter, DHA1 family, tetracycline resistance protein